MKTIAVIPARYASTRMPGKPLADVLGKPMIWWVYQAAKACPKLDDVDYSEKLTAIIRSNDIQEVTVVRMEVPCCGGLENAAKRALQASGKFIPWQVVTISTDGRILD